MPKEITTHSEALTCALVLAVTSPTDAKSAECLKMAEEFAAWLSAEEIEQAKAQALIQTEQWEMEETHGKN
ncbi:MAG TPA: hypothetical protein VL200_06295 [Lacunisphaera sp.]|nr:hypothetical protein [Lacunisphaera sp.]